MAAVHGIRGEPGTVINALHASSLLVLKPPSKMTVLPGSQMKKLRLEGEVSCPEAHLREWQDWDLK